MQSFACQRFKLFVAGTGFMFVTRLKHCYWTKKILKKACDCLNLKEQGLEVDHTDRGKVNVHEGIIMSPVCLSIEVRDMTEFVAHKNWRNDIGRPELCPEIGT